MELVFFLINGIDKATSFQCIHDKRVRLIHYNSTTILKEFRINSLCQVAYYALIS